MPSNEHLQALAAWDLVGYGSHNGKPAEIVEANPDAADVQPAAEAVAAEPEAEPSVGAESMAETFPYGSMQVEDAPAAAEETPVDAQSAANAEAGAEVVAEPTPAVEAGTDAEAHATEEELHQDAIDGDGIFDRPAEERYAAEHNAPAPAVAAESVATDDPDRTQEFDMSPLLDDTLEAPFIATAAVETPDGEAPVTAEEAAAAAAELPVDQVTVEAPRSRWNRIAKAAGAVVLGVAAVGVIIEATPWGRVVHGLAQFGQTALDFVGLGTIHSNHAEIAHAAQNAASTPAHVTPHVDPTPVHNIVSGAYTGATDPHTGLLYGTPQEALAQHMMANGQTPDIHSLAFQQAASKLSVDNGFNAAGTNVAAGHVWKF